MKARQLFLFLAALKWESLSCIKPTCVSGPSSTPLGWVRIGLIPLHTLSFQNCEVSYHISLRFSEMFLEANIPKSLCSTTHDMVPSPSLKQSPNPQKWRTKRKQWAPGLKPGYKGNTLKVLSTTWRGMGTCRVWQYLTCIRCSLWNKWISRILTTRKWNKNRSI